MKKMLFFMAVCMLVAVGCGPAEKQGRNAPDAPADHMMRKWFEASRPQTVVLRTAAGDVNADGREDLIVIYPIGPEVNRMVVVLDLPGGPRQTNEVPAPVANQQIQFRDIDDKPPLEFIVRGSKGTQVGMAVFRVTEGTLEDLFGSNMADCCN